MENVFEAPAEAGIIGSDSQFSVISGKSGRLSRSDANGNVITYFGSRSLGEKGDKITFSAKIKKHDEYKGIKQTINHIGSFVINIVITIKT